MKCGLMNKDTSFMTHSDNDEILSYSLHFPSYSLLVLCEYSVSGAEMASYNAYCWSKVGPGFTWTNRCWYNTKASGLREES